MALAQVLKRAPKRLPSRPGSGGGGRNQKRSSSIRPDIQGLRAFAVIAVVLDHLLGWPRSGFVGVDVFFVLSGFLITGLLLREHDRSGRISFVGFYKRRAKRILPAAVLVLLTTTAASFLVFNTGRAWNTLWDAIWAFFFVANWRQASIGTDYFAAGGPVSPLQHYWSLAVEEQFYFIWPWLMLGLFAITANIFKGRANPRIVAGIAMAVITAGSLAWSIWDTNNNPSVAYFSTTSRAWELGIGAILACGASVLPRIPTLLRPFLAWAGLVGMVVSLFVIDPQGGFPGPSALLPVLSTALVIAAGTGTSQHRFLAPLTNRVSRYVGDISYSLYLWHFPAIILVGSLADLTNPLVIWGVLGVTAACSVYSYHLVEDPIRKSTWLTENPKRRERSGGPLFSDAYRLTALSALAVLTVAVVVPVLQPPARTVVASTVAKAPSTASAAATVSPAGPELAKLQPQILKALSADSWPSGNPSMDDAINGPQAADDIAACGKGPTVDDGDCTFGDPQATKTAFIIGDSVAMTYAGVLRTAIGEASGWNLKVYSIFGCTFTDRLVASPGSSDACPARKQLAIDEINATKPDVVFVSNTYEARIPNGESQPLSAGDWSASTMKLVSQFQGAAKKVVFLAPPPSEIDIKKCYNRVTAPNSCITRVTNQWFSTAKAETDMAKQVKGEWVDSKPWFCAPSGDCPSFVGSTATKLDLVHMTPEYGQMIAPSVGEQLKSQKIL